MAIIKQSLMKKHISAVSQPRHIEIDILSLFSHFWTSFEKAFLSLPCLQFFLRRDIISLLFHPTE